MESRDLELFHFGVKGMKWGVRRDKNSKKTKEAKEKPAPKRSRKELRQINREGARKFYEAKSERVIKEVMTKQGDVLISAVTPSSPTYPTVYTGKEFAKYLSNGGAFDPKYTDIFARKGTHNGNPVWMKNEQMNERYKKVKR